MLELKPNQATKFEWQKHSQDSKDILHYSTLLKFINLRAQASENAIREPDQKCRTPTAEKKCYPQIPSYAVNVNDLCVTCKLGIHLLYACEKIKTLSHKEMVTILKQNGFYLNCLKLSDDTHISQSSDHHCWVLLPNMPGPSNSQWRFHHHS